ncbi:hypothetical protein KSP39_PZI014167 [Platanthera zijinensis]|uniref:Uncharacterized protein n=1 Tax=Platanthera zijinensis TaxID=2320716 RepID=A0AAP0G3U6_9ASPA
MCTKNTSQIVLSCGTEGAYGTVSPQDHAQPSTLHGRSPGNEHRGPSPSVQSLSVNSRQVVGLSEMDILDITSMKSAAKYDTWCELQNPVNHRVFERKLRLRPAGQGHVRMGVKH